MKMSKRFFACLALSLVLIASAFVLVACNGQPEYSVDESDAITIEGVYYCDGTPDGSEWKLSLDNNRGYVLELSDGEHKGKYFYNGKTFSLDVKDYGVKLGSDGKSITLTYDGATYRFILEVGYTVTFNANGGSAVAAQTVTNGKAALRPADPAKDGYAFVGWYTDDGFATKYDFRQPVSGDLTLYARYVEESDGENEFYVFFDLNGKEGAAIEPMTTIGKKAYNLPDAVADDGSEFIGWWTSDYEDGAKLTAQYAEQQIEENITLYAVWANDGLYVSAANGQISWSSAGVNASYKVVIKNLTAGSESERTMGERALVYNFSEAGDYEIIVTSSAKSGKAYYQHKRLAKVSNFSVEGNLLKFNAVPNAQKYYITLDCGTEGHSHVLYDNGAFTTYDFSACDMKEEGITFIVTAEAEGYISSVSDEFVFIRTLAMPEGLAINDGVLTWEAVENATGYVLTIDEVAIALPADRRSFDFGGYAKGEYAIAVYATAKGYNPSAAAAYAYNKQTLPAPAALAVSGDTVSWNAVEGAIGYLVSVNGNVYEAEGTSLVLAEEVFSADIAQYEIRVMAIAEDEAENSAYTAPVTLSVSFDTAEYGEGEICWNPIKAAQYYVVYLNDEKLAEVRDGSNAYAIEFEAAGVHTVSVSFVDHDGKESAAIDIEVAVYEIALDVDGALIDVDNLYKAYGDPIELPDGLENRGYTFGGWYNVKNGAENNGIKFEDAYYPNEYNVTLYAYWISNPYLAKTILDVESNIGMDQTVYYGKDYSLGLGFTSDDLKAFAGWYTEPNRGGTRYTDENGNSLKPWDDLRNVTLYPGFVDILSFELINEGTEYAVSQGIGIAYVKTITIPAEYNGLPVTTIESNAFKSCTQLKVINIPDTIKDIVTQTAFQSASNLTDINIYKVSEEDVYEIFYASYDGLLYYNNPYSGVSLAYVPAGKTGTYEMPSYLDFGELDGAGEKVLSPVRIIPESAFGGADPNSSATANISKLVISHTVTTIGAKAFVNASFTSASNSKMRQIEFEATPEGEEAVDLYIAANAFQGLYYLESITLPARLKNFEPEAFDGCSRLAAINIEESENGLYKSVDGIVYNKNLNTIISVPYAYTTESGSFTIPNGVTTIATKAFAYNRELTEIIIPGWVTLIDDYAFCRTGVSTDGSVTRYSNSTITSLIFLGKKAGDDPDPDLTIGECAFYGLTGITELKLPENLRNLGDAAFGGTSKVTEVYVNTVGEVNFADYAFASISSTGGTRTFYVTDVHIGKDTGAFAITGVFGATKLVNIFVEEGNPNYKSVDGVLYNLEMTSIVFYPAGREGAFIVPDTVEEIAANTFYDREGLTEVTIGYNVRSIGDMAFYSCGALTAVHFAETPAGQEDVPMTIGKEAFRLCNNAEFNSIVLPERVTSIDEKAFMTCSYLTYIYVPSTVTYLGMTKGSYGNALSFVDYTLARLETVEISEDNENYASIDGIIYELNEDGYPVTLLFCPRAHGGIVDVPKTVTKIQDSAFFYNQNVTEVMFSEGCDGELDIGEYAFYDAEKLAKIDLPEGLKAIKTKAFYYAPITEIVIPSTVETIEKQAFYSNRKLETVTFAPTPEGQDPVALTLYGGMDGSSSYGNSYYGAFYYCTALKNLVLPERTVEIGDYALTAAYAYQGSTNYMSLEEIVIPSTVQRIGSYAFYYNDKLKKVSFADGCVLEELGDYAFSQTGLEEIDLPESLVKINRSCFYNCTNLTYIEIPASVERIETWAFYNAGLEEIVFAENSKLNYIGTNAIYNTKITEIVIPKSVTHIDNYGLASNKLLESVEFELTDDGEGGKYSNLAKLGTYVFQGTALTSFVFPEAKGPIEIGTVNTSNVYTKHLFSGCTQLKSVHLSSSVSNIDNMFAGCKSLQSITIADNHPNFSFRFGDDSILFNNPASEDEGLEIRLVVRLGEGGVMTLPSGLTGISSRAFENKTDLVKVVIPNTVKSIGSYAFSSCINLREVEFEEGSQLTEITERMFSNCSMLQSIVLPDSIKSIGKYAFYTCVSLKTVEFPKYLEAIGQNAFNGCTHLQEANIPSSVKNIGNNAFSYCVSLTKANVPAAIGTTGVVNSSDVYGNNIFSYNVSLTDLTIEDGVHALSNYMFRNCTALTEVNIPESCKNIAQGAFTYCYGITEIELPATLTTIGNNAFDYTGLTSIEIPASVTSIGDSAFRHNDHLEEVTFAKKEGGAEITTTLGNYAFADDPMLTAFDIPSTMNWTTASTAATADTYLFQNSGLKRIVIPNGAKITWLSNYMFAGCADLEEVIFAGNNVVNFGTYVFQGTTSLKSITLPSGLKLSTPSTAATSAAYAFQNSGLESIVIPDSATITCISNYMFDGCANLASVTFEGNRINAFGTYAFRGTTSLKNFTLPSNLKMTTASTAGTSAYYAFQNSGLESITIPASTTITYISNYMFDGCDKLEEVIFEEGSKVVNIGQHAFSGTTSLKSINLPKGLKLSTASTAATSATYAFQNSGLESITIPDSSTITYISNYMFDGCSELEEVIFEGTKVTAFGTYAFRGTTSLTSIELSPNFATLGTNVFQNSGLESITLPSKVTAIPNYAFAGCEYLEGVEIEGNVTTIGTQAFYGCSALTEFEIPATVTTINQQALAMTGITNIEVPAKVTSIGQGAFAGAPVTEFKVAAGNTKYMAFEGIIYDTNGVVVAFPAGITGEFTVPAGVTGTGRIFEGSKITKLIIEDGEDAITEIPQYMFYGMADVKEIVLPSTITKIGSYAFSGCTSLERITLPGSITSWNSYMFQNCTSLKEVVFEEGITTTYAGSATTGMFVNSPDLETVVLPSTLESIGAYTFYNTSIKSITLPAGLKTIANYAFSGCTNIEEIVLPAGLTTIGTNAFEGTKIKTITIPNSVASIGNGAFMNCADLEEVIFEDDDPETEEPVTLVLTAGTASSYVVTAGMFFGCDKIESIILPERTMTVNDYVFAGLNGLKLLDMSKPTMTKTGSYIGLGCPNLENVIVGPDVTLSSSAFSYSQAQNVTLMEGITTLPVSCFAFCNTIKNLYVPSTVVNMGSGGFIFNNWQADQTVYFTYDMAQEGFAPGWCGPTTSFNSTLGIMPTVNCNFVWGYNPAEEE